MEQEELNHLINSQKEYIKSRQKFVGMISTMLLGILGLLIALKPDSIKECNQKVVYLISLILISLGVIFSLIFLYTEVAYAKRDRDSRQNIFLSQHNSKSESINKILSYEKLYRFCEKATYICLLLSMMTMIWYFCLSEF